MSDQVDTVVCGNPACGHVFGAYPSAMEANPEERTPCPGCGATGRLVQKAPLTAQVTMQGSLSYDAHPPGPKSNRRRFAWGFTGWDWSHRLQRLVRKDSHFDKRADRRYEHVEDPKTGEVLHHQDQPLTEHRGHGSDKAKPWQDDDH